MRRTKDRLLLLAILSMHWSMAQNKKLKLIKEISSFEKGGYQVEHLGPNCLLGDTLFIADHRRVLAFTKEGKYLYQWGNSLIFNKVTQICSGPNGTIYTLDFSSAKISKFDRWGNLLLSWRTRHIPLGIKCDQAGNVYVSEYEQIIKYDLNGKLVRKWGSHGSGEGQFDNPVGLAFDDHNYLYVADEYNYRIQKFDTAGHFQLSFDTKKYVYKPSQIAIRDTLLYAMGERFMAEFNLNGKFLRKIEFGFMNPNYSQLSVDKNNHFFLNDHNKFYHLDQDGKAIAVWGNKADDETGFRGPYGLASTEDGHLLVSDESKHLKQTTDDGLISVVPEPKGPNSVKISRMAEILVDKKKSSIYGITRYSNAVMKIFLKTGTKGLEEIERIQYPETKSNGEDFIQDICSGAKGEYYIVYPSQQKIVAIDENLVPVYHWGTPGDSCWQLKQPIAVGYFQEKVYVGDNGKIKIFDRKGKFQDCWVLPERVYAKDIKFDKSGNVYVLGCGSLFVFSQKGKLIAQQELGYVDICPYSSVHVDQRGYIYVSMEYDNKILIYELAK